MHASFTTRTSRKTAVQGGRNLKEGTTTEPRGTGVDILPRYPGCDSLKPNHSSLDTIYTHGGSRRPLVEQDPETATLDERPGNSHQ